MNTIVDVYTVNSQVREAPFQHPVNLRKGRCNIVVTAMGTADGGALIGAMCSRRYRELPMELRRATKSGRWMRMADGGLVPSEGVWSGWLEVEGIAISVRLEIFDSGGCWDVLLGKPILRQLRAVHDYAKDIVAVKAREGDSPTLLESKASTKASATVGDDDAPVETSPHIPPRRVDNVIEEATDNHRQHLPDSHTNGTPVHTVLDEGTNIFTRHTEPFKPERVKRVVEEVRLGKDLTEEQRAAVRELIAEFADCFALSLREVNAVPGAVHKLNVPEGASFSTKVGARKRTPAQRQFMDKKIDEMLEAGVIRPIHPSEVRCAAQTVLAPKERDDGLPLAELQHMVNDQCVSHGMEPIEDLPPRPEPRTPSGEGKPASSWRICHNFREINKVTEIAPMPQGEIRMKQQNLSGHRYIHVFDFAAGFYAVTVHEDSQPFITFYVEGRGYFAYVRMPFGVTGGPSSFAHLTASKFHDLVAEGTCELFVDDGGAASDTFEEGMTKLRRILERVRREKLSLSAGKMRVFMTEAVFAGAVVGPGGVTPDVTKLTAMVNWPTPKDAAHLEGFLGLTGYFRDLIPGYALTEKPLRDLLRRVGVPKGTRKAQYQRLMKGYKLEEEWREEHTKAFLTLKARLVSKPVLCAPRFDGTPFIMTTDGCKDAFAGVLTQRVKVTLPGGKSKTKLNPIGFVSKRTSPAEENYKPFLLEFAALKFSLDKFSDIIWGYPIEIETDCQALRDVLTNDKLNATHARWRDGVMAYDIREVRHVPGAVNIADGLSRQYEGVPRGDDEDSAWSVDPDWQRAAGVEDAVWGVEEVEDDQLNQLRTRFKEETYFSDILDALYDIKPSRKMRLRDVQRARHRAKNYMVDEGKLWFVGGGTKIRAKARRECVTREEAVALAREEHERGGHWHRDGIKIALLDRIHRPGLDELIIQGIRTCPRCKNFGGSQLNALLQPITRRHPFELLVGDYLKMPVGKGGYHTVGLYLDTFSQHVWGYMFKTHGSAKTTVKSLKDIFQTFAPTEMFMTDGGSHFDNEEVRAVCSEWGAKTDVVAAYSPWVNGLVEGTNKLLLYVLARLCAPEVGEDGWQEMTWDDLPRTWTDHFEHAIRILNWRILPALKFSPKELLLGLVVNTVATPLEASASILPPTDVDTHMAYAAQQRLDGYSETVHHAIRRKAAFDRKVERSKDGPITFEEGQLVQVHRSDLFKTLAAERKLKPMWSAPKRVTKRLTNSYELEELDGTPIPGRFHARRLRLFEPREGTELWKEQQERSRAARGAVGGGAGETGEANGEPRVGEERDGEDGDRDGEEEEESLEESRSGDGEETECGRESEGEDEGLDSVAGRLVARRRGGGHFGGGQVE